MQRTLSTLFTLIVWVGSTLAQTQTRFWDLEGPNDLEGWRMHDGSPLQTTTGVSSSTAILLPTGPPVGNFDSPSFIYHPLPYDPNVNYNVTFWQRNSSQNVYVAAFLAWVDTLSVPAQLTGVNTMMTTTGAAPWVCNEFWDEWSLPGFGTFCICIAGNSSAPDELFIDNVSVELVPQGAALLWDTRLFLGGNYEPGLERMGTDLSTQGLLPLSEPYYALGYPQVGGGGDEWCTPAVVHPDNLYRAVDWVRIELRSATDPSVIVATKQGMLTSLGSIASFNGQLSFNFGVPAGDYYVAVRHRNHLGAMTALPVTLSATMYASSIDLRSPAQSTWGTEARKSEGSYRLLWPGDVNGDGVVKYVGTNNDRDPILVAVGGSSPTNIVSNVYDVRDVNLNGTIKYVGVGNDRDPLLLSIPAAMPTNTRVAQLP